MLSWPGQGEFHLLHCITNTLLQETKEDQERDAKPIYKVRVDITKLAFKKIFFFFNEND